VVAAALDRLIGAKHFFDGGAQGFGAINDKQIFAIGG
jgi:hypothetical protein